MGDDGSGSGEAIDFILYMFVLGPSVEWCLKSPRVNKGRPATPRGVALAVLLLAAVAGAKLSFDLVGREPNHFETLGLRVDATTFEIKKAYKQISLKLHPDKNPNDKNAAEKFIKYQSAYEVLKDSAKRDKYNKFGQAGLDDKSSDTGSQLMSLSLFYVIWLVVGYLLTMGRASEDGRTWAFSGLLALAVFEYQTRILSVDYLAPIFPRSTVHEKVELLHKLFPPFMHGARMISQVIFMDITLVNKMRLQEMNRKTDELFRLVWQLAGPTPKTLPPLANLSALSGLPAQAGGAEPAAAAAAEDTAIRLAAAGALPQMRQEAPAGAAQAGAAAGGAGEAAAASGGSAGGAASGGDAAAMAAAQESMAEASRNRDRMTNVVVFFIVFACYRWVVAKELF